jgi:RNA polymerase sigma-70 factor (ECF subfamily)
MEARMSVAGADFGIAEGAAESRWLPLSDEALLMRIVERDQAALRMLAERHQARVYRFAMKFVRDASLAEDVVSETFFAVWQNAPGFRSQSAVGTWILSIARYRALTIRERATDTGEPLDEEAVTRIPDPSQRTDASVDQADLVTCVRDCLGQLPAEQAMLIDMVYLRGRPIREAALVAGIPLNTVKSRMFLARKKLAGLLAAAGFDSGAPHAAFG